VIPTRVWLRRRLLLVSTPLAVVVLLAALKMISLVLAGNSAITDFRGRDTAALRDDVAVLNVFNVIDPEKALFATGDLAVLERRLDEADAQFSAALSRTDPARSCPVRINLELVREVQGDTAVGDGNPDRARERYTTALAVIDAAPAGCFAGNPDPEPERRALRSEAAARVGAKLAALNQPPPPPAAEPSAPQPFAPPPPPIPVIPVITAPDVAQPPRRLDPGEGNPLERLQQLLQDSAAARDSGR
jgi:hypothetical protein